ncbi:MAG TPA: hypothetical protein VH165_35530 [Kofleriaceae bacterium]|jgi:hypothetical protein|nr:hypothetical protein [Kofleriaceae bacterium]
MRTAGISAAVALSVVSVVSLAALPAGADTSKAWSAAKAGLPADAKIVVGIDLAAIQKTQLFVTYYPKLLAKKDAAQVINMMKTSCKLDPLTVLAAVVVATAADSDDGAAYVAFSGVDKAKLSTCLQAAVQNNDKDTKVTIKNDGNVSQITKELIHHDGSAAPATDTMTTFVGWVGKDVLVVPFKASDKAAVARWMGGKGAFAKSDLGKSLAKVNTSAAVWGAGEQTKELQPGVTIKGGYGAIKLAGGSIDADVHAVMQSASAATSLAATATTQLDQAKQAGMLSPAINSVLSAVKISTANDEIVVKAVATEKDLLGLIEFAAAAGAMGSD